MKHQSSLLSTYGIYIGIGIAAILAGIIITPSIQKKLTSLKSATKFTTIEGIRYETDLKKPLLQQVHIVLTKSVKPTFIPKTILFTKMQKEPVNPGSTYIASWNIDGKFFSHLVGLTADNSKISYIRIWHMPKAQQMTNESATVLAREVFLDSFTQAVGPISCAPQSSVAESAITECGSLKSQQTGDLYGITIKSPISLTPPPNAPSPSKASTAVEVTIVSSCFVPKDGTRFYTASMCI